MLILPKPLKAAAAGGADEDETAEFDKEYAELEKKLKSLN
jgi:hypothetical protein